MRYFRLLEIVLVIELRRENRRCLRQWFVVWVANRIRLRGKIKVSWSRPHAVANLITGLHCDAWYMMRCLSHFRRHFLDALHELPQETSNVNINGSFGGFASNRIERYLLFGVEVFLYHVECVNPQHLDFHSIFYLIFIFNYNLIYF